MLRLKIWGSRGGVPMSGARVARHGGATTCLEIERLDPRGEVDQRVIIDCGTGLVDLGHSWGERGLDTLLLQTHFHWDHLDGFPFFAPFYNPGARFEIWATPRDGMTMRRVVDDRLSGPSFPIDLGYLPAKLVFRDIVEHGRHTVGRLEIAWTEMVHPSGSTAWRITDLSDGASLVFTGDVEVRHGCRDALVAFSAGADLVVMDAQYTVAEYPQREGFGHSTTADAVGVAADAGVGRLVLTHHDAAHDDVTLDAKLTEAREIAVRNEVSMQIDNAFDGMVATVSPARVDAGAWPRPERAVP